MTKKLLLVAVLATFLFAGAAQAQTEDLPAPGMLPGNPFYFLKSVTEGIGTFFTFGDVAKANRLLALAEVRASEINALVDRGDIKRAEKATERYQAGIDRALARAEKAKERGKDVDELLARFAEKTIRHQEVLLRVYEKVPERAKEAIEKVIERSIIKHDRAVEAVSSEKKEEVRIRVRVKKDEIRVRFEEAKRQRVLDAKTRNDLSDEDSDDE